VHWTNLFTELLVALSCHEPSQNDTAESGVLCRLLSESEPPGGPVFKLECAAQGGPGLLSFFLFLGPSLLHLAKVHLNFESLP